MGRRDETFILYYWEDYEQYTMENPSCFYCLSESTVQIILSALRFAGWRTRWRLDRQDNSRRLEDDSIWNQIDALAALAQKEVVDDMTCDLENAAQIIADAMTANSPTLAFEHIAQAIKAIADKPCCGDASNIGVNGGVVSQYTDGDGLTHPIYGTQPPTTNDGVTPPDGFATYEDYLLNKCQIANLVFDGWLLTLRGLSGFTVFNATALAVLIGLAIPGVIAFPPAAIPIMIGALIVLGVEVTVLGGIADELQSHKADIVCSLYRSDTVEEMVSVLADAIDAAIAFLELTGPIGAAVKTVAMLLVNSDTLSQLLSGVAGASYPDADCSSCIGCHETFYPAAAGVRGAMTVVSQTDTTFEAEGAPYSDRARWDWGFAINSTGYAAPCGAPPTITSWTITAGAIDGSSGASPSVKIYDGTGATIYSDTVIPSTFPDTGMYFEIVSGVDFTSRIEWEYND